jgi:SAM-dependent methyltransferase
LAPSYFKGLYDKSSDPWSLATRWYERRKYAMTLASLSRPRYRRGFEPGCSVGVLTEGLAERCDSLLSTDVAASAVSATRSRVSGAGGVEVAELTVPAEWPEGSFDLVVISELGYYLSADDLELLVERTVGCLDTDGEIVLVHWRHPVADYPLLGEEVHAAFHVHPDLEVLACHDEADFLLEVFVPHGTQSVATREGLT